MTTRTLALVLGLALLAVPAAAAAAEREAATFTGTYDWKQGGSDELSAEFTPDGPDRWKVTFRFRFDGKERTWKGTAEGSLNDGTKVTGTARNKKKNFEWKATVEAGVMRGRHTEIFDGGRKFATGTFEVSR